MKLEALLVFGREPIPGRVKTRLAKQVGPQAAADVYSELLTLTIETCRGINIKKFLYLTPGDKIYIQDRSFSLRVQVGNDLGLRMDHAFRECFSSGFKRVVLIGSDCPYLSAKILFEAFSALLEYDTVFGPALDGGYYLVGQTAPARDLFSGIAWSSAEVWSQTKVRLVKNQWSYKTLDTLEDIDDLDSLKRYQKESIFKKKP